MFVLFKMERIFYVLMNVGWKSVLRALPNIFISMHSLLNILFTQLYVKIKSIYKKYFSHTGGKCVLKATQ